MSPARRNHRILKAVRREAARRALCLALLALAPAAPAGPTPPPESPPESLPESLPESQPKSLAKPLAKPLARPLARPLVVATIKPLALIARDLLGQGAEIRQLLPDGASPHGYALRISERRLLAQADLVLWVGPGLESFLADALRARPAEQVLTAAGLSGIHWPPGHSATGRHDASAGEANDHETDLHLWLDPRNAAVIADALAAHLAARGYAPQPAAAEFAARMAGLETDIGARLAVAPERTFAADHEAFGHFAARFGLRPAGHLRDAADHATGARSLAALSARTDIRCLIAEPDSKPERMHHLAARLGARVQVVDALGAGIPAGQGTGYAALLDAVADDFARCLGAPGS